MTDGTAAWKKAVTDLSRAGLETFLASQARVTLRTHADPLVSVILVLFNRAELTFRCLRSLVEHDSIPLEVIAVDNASSDSTAALLRRCDGVKAMRNRENRGFVLAANQGARRSRGRYLLFLNNDAELLPGSLASALAVLRTADDVAAVGGRIILMDGSLQEAGSVVWSDGSCLGYGRGDSPLQPMYMFERDVDYCSGAFLLTRRDVFLGGGGFDETYAPAYYEDVDYCFRLWEGGHRVVYDPGAVILHFECASSTSASAAIELQRDHRSRFVALHRDRLRERPAPGSDLLLARSVGTSSELRVLFIDDRVPHASLGSGYPRAREMLLAMERLGCSVTVYPLWRPDEGWDAVYADIPRSVEVMIGWGFPRFAEFLRERAGYYDRVVVSRPPNMRRLRPLLREEAQSIRGARLVYDSEAVFVLRDAARRRLTGEHVPEIEVERLLAEEMELADDADTVIAVSPSEGARFVQAGCKRVVVVGHAVTVAPTPQPFADRSEVLFVGAMHEDVSPNADSVVWFVSDILPSLRWRLGAHVRLTVAGANGSFRVAALGARDVRMQGCIEDLRALYAEARIFVAPTRFGAGIPIKILDAAASGVPVVCTSLVAGQLGWRDGHELLVADDEETFAERCAALYRDFALWERLRAGALERIHSDHSREAFVAALGQALGASASRAGA